MPKVSFLKNATPDMLDSAVTALETKGLSVEFAMLEKPDAFIFERFSDALKQKPWSQWCRGRLFGTDRELCWRQREGGAFHLVYVTELDDRLPGFSDPIELTTPEEESLMTWGTYDKDLGGWHEKRIARILQYPVNGQPVHVQLLARRYELLDGSEMYRYLGVSHGA